MTLSLQIFQFILSGLTTGSTYALIAIGFSLIHNATGIVNFAQGEFVMLVLDEGCMETFSHLLSVNGKLFLNSPASSSHLSIDATGLAAAAGSPLMANLVLLGFALTHNGLFCDYPLTESVTRRISPERFRETNLNALKLGYSFRDPGRRR